jgi:hypothetical protein
MRTILDKKKLLESLKEALDAEEYLPPQQADLLFKREGTWYAAVLQVAREPRRLVMEGLLAAAMLRVQEYVKHELNTPVPLAVVAAPSLSKVMLADLAAFAAQFGRFEGQVMAWGVIDERGLVEISGPGLTIHRHASIRKVDHALPSSPNNLFTDLSQWMLKVLLNPMLPPPFGLNDQNGRALAAVGSAVELAQSAKVSVAHAARFLTLLREDKFLERDYHLKLIRLETLLARWQAAYRVKRPLEVRARWLFPRKDSKVQLQEMLSREWKHKREQRVCLGLFAACEIWNFPHVQGVAPHVLVKRYSPELLRTLKLTVAEPGESVDVFLREPLFPETVFRGVQLREGLPVADILQCWLDVADHPARGEEMAQILYHKVITPYFLKDE